MPRNDLRKKGLFELLERHGLTLGQQIDRPRPEYAAHYRQTYQTGQRPPATRHVIEPACTSTLAGQVGILIAGSAGQKIKSTATAFGEGAMYARLSATQKDDYPITVQTGHSVAEVILSPERIDYTGIDTPEHLVIVSEDGLHRIRAMLPGLPASTVVYAEETLDLPPMGARVQRYPFAQAAKRVGRLALVTVALGALLEDSGLYPLAAFELAIRARQSDKLADVSVRALAAGAALARTTEKRGDSP